VRFRWTTPRWCAWASTAAASRTTAIASLTGSGRSAAACSIDVPSMYSVATHGRR
jgi:hypothetical protein